MKLWKSNTSRSIHRSLFINAFPLILIFCVNNFSIGQTIIPDKNLRLALKKQGYLYQDSILNHKKASVLLQLELNGMEIENIEGLQFFKQAWNLSLRNNRIKRLDKLPPHLTTLDCSYNNLEKIDYLPINLKYLNCSYNKIRKLSNLSLASLISIDFQGNEVKHFPVLSKKLEYVNYYKNPIKASTLPIAFGAFDCNNPWQNCLPNDLVNWKILDNNINDTTFQITGMI